MMSERSCVKCGEDLPEGSWLFFGETRSGLCCKCMKSLVESKIPVVVGYHPASFFMDDELYMFKSWGRWIEDHRGMYNGNVLWKRGMLTEYSDGVTQLQIFGTRADGNEFPRFFAYNCPIPTMEQIPLSKYVKMNRLNQKVDFPWSE